MIGPVIGSSMGPAAFARLVFAGAFVCLAFLVLCAGPAPVRVVAMRAVLVLACITGTVLLELLP